MVRVRDVLTADMFDVPAAPPATPGSINYSREIAAVMSQALKDCPYDRIEVAARMSRLLGREVTVAMLNAYTAESRETHNINLERAIAFDAATEGYALLDFYAGKRGCRALVGKDALLAELGRLEQARAEISGKASQLRKLLNNNNKSDR